MNKKFLQLKEVENLVGFKKTTIYSLIKAGNFPAQIKINRSSRWLESDIDKWIETQANNQSAA